MSSSIRAASALLAAVSTLLPACGGEGTSPAGETPQKTCAAGQELFRDRCVDPAARYEPDERIDQDNVVAFGDPLVVLALPDPPKSGFRIVAPPRTMMPGEEVDICVAWPFPEVTNDVIYSSRIYTTPGLHHSNVISKPVDAELGANPYPGCHPGADDPFSDIANSIPDVLFANSTQVVGAETLTFPVGMGYHVDTSREITTNIHFLNSTAEPQVVEVAYDFFTMTDEDLVEEVAPFFMQVNDFLVPPHVTADVGATCDVFGGRVVSMMPHTHELAEDFSVDFVPFVGDEERVFADGNYDLESDIRVFDPPLDLTEIDKVRFTCTFNNTTDHDVVYGLGENEMCILFGYVTPVKNQWVSYSEYQGDPCQSVQIGLFHP